jgi:hypothetical protein
LWSKFVILVYVDILLASNNKDMLHHTKNFLFNNFKIKNLDSYIFGIEILRDKYQDRLHHTKKNYLKMNDLDNASYVLGIEIFMGTS